MQDFLGYMFFSFIEGMAVFALTLYLFRINMMEYFKPIILTNLFINVVSYFIREDSRFTNLSPIMNLAICVLFMALVVRTPLIWSMLIVLTGYMAFGFLQLTIIFFSFTPAKELQEAVWKAHIVQGVTGIIGTAIGFAIYRLGYGFTFEFDKLRFKWERILIGSVIIIFFITVILALSSQSLFIILVVFAIAFVFFLLYSYWKDARE